MRLTDADFVNHPKFKAVAKQMLDRGEELVRTGDCDNFFLQGYYDIKFFMNAPRLCVDILIWCRRIRQYRIESNLAVTKFVSRVFYVPFEKLTYKEIKELETLLTKPTAVGQPRYGPSEFALIHSAMLCGTADDPRTDEDHPRLRILTKEEALTLIDDLSFNLTIFDNVPKIRYEAIFWKKEPDAYPRIFLIEYRRISPRVPGMTSPMTCPLKEWRQRILGEIIRNMSGK